MLQWQKIKCAREAQRHRGEEARKQGGTETERQIATSCVSPKRQRAGDTPALRTPALLELQRLIGTFCEGRIRRGARGCVRMLGNGKILSGDDEDYRRHGLRPAGVYVSAAVRGGGGRGGGIAVCVLERLAGNSCAARLPAECGDGAVRGRRAIHRDVRAAAADFAHVQPDSASIAGGDSHHRRSALRAALGSGHSARAGSRVARYSASPAGGRGEHVDNAVSRRAIPESFRPQRAAQDRRNLAGDPDRAALHQRTNFHDVLQSDLSGSGKLRV